MLLSTFPTVTIFQSTFTGYQNETHIAAVRDDLSRLAPTAAETCFSCAIKCQCDNGAIGTISKETPCFQFAAEESPLQVCVCFLHQTFSSYCWPWAAFIRSAAQLTRFVRDALMHDD
jgi:hypothetical protein